MRTVKFESSLIEDTNIEKLQLLNKMIKIFLDKELTKTAICQKLNELEENSNLSRQFNWGTGSNHIWVHEVVPATVQGKNEVKRLVLVDL